MIKKFLLYLDARVNKLLYRLFSKDIKKYYAFEKQFLSNNICDINSLYGEYVAAINDAREILNFRDRLKKWTNTVNDTEFENIRYIISMCIISKQHSESLMNNIFNPYMIAIIVLILDKMIEIYIASPIGNVLIYIMLTLFLIKTLLFFKNEFYKDAIKQDFYKLLYNELTNEEPR